MPRRVLLLGLLFASCSFDEGGLPGNVDDSGPGDPDGIAADAGVDADLGCGLPGAGDPCDGADTDDCEEGVQQCNQAGDALVCTDTTDSSMEICDGAAADEDCDGMSDEGFDVGVACDGADMDMCTEGGVWECDGGGGRQCTDTSGDTLEVCDDGAMDEDCDGMFDEDWDTQTDEQHCGNCATVCQANNTTSNMCLTGTCSPVCTAGAHNCDGNPANGCEQRNTNPTCAAPAPANLGTISGDVGAASASDSFYSERWYVITIEETAQGGSNPRADVVLTNPAGVNFDLYVYCTSNCPTGATTLTSTAGAGMPDTVLIGNTDSGPAVDDTFTVLIEVRFSSASACGNYTLTVTGHTSNGANTCGP
jgi:hypothetical protein